MKKENEGLKTPICKPDDIKIFVLHLIHQINRPMSFVELNEIVEVTEHIQYIDFVDAFYTMIEDGLIDPVGKGLDGDELFFVTKKGLLVGDGLKSEFREAMLKESTTAAHRYLKFSKDKGLTCDCEIHRLEVDKSYTVEFRIFNRDKEVIHASINTESEEQARQMTKNIYANPDVILLGMTALMSGDVNYIWGTQDPKKKPSDPLSSPEC